MGEGSGDSEALRRAALRLLERREHGGRELCLKLRGRGFDETTAAAVVAELAEAGLQSDRRYAEAFVRDRAGRGYGPVRVQAELRERGVDAEVIDTALAAAGPDWREAARAQRAKRFGAAPPDGDRRERARQAQYLSRRGFSAEQVDAALEG